MIVNSNNQSIYSLFTENKAFNPNNATNYYWGSTPQLPEATAGNNRPVQIPYTGLLIGATMVVTETTLFGTTEASTINFRLNNTTNTALFSAINNSATYKNSITGLSVPVTAGDYFEINWLTPTWVTRPQGSIFNIQLIFART